MVCGCLELVRDLVDYKKENNLMTLGDSTFGWNSSHQYTEGGMGGRVGPRTETGEWVVLTHMIERPHVGLCLLWGILVRIVFVGFGSWWE